MTEITERERAKWAAVARTMGELSMNAFDKTAEGAKFWLVIMHRAKRLARKDTED